MFMERDEGIDLNSSGPRDYPSFVPDESTFRPSNRTQNVSQKSMIFPQRLDLSTMHNKVETPKKASKKENRKKISPIKANSDSRLHKSLNFSENSMNFGKKHNETVDLATMKTSFDQLAMNLSMRKGSSSSITSDRASSVSSSSSGQSLSQKSIFVQVSRAKKLIDQKRKEEEEEEEKKKKKKKEKEGEKERNENKKKGKNTREQVFSDSDWHIDDNDNQEHFHGKEKEHDNDDTRPPSSQPSLSVEHPRRGATMNLMSSMDRIQKPKAPSTIETRNTGTSSQTICLSDSQLYEIYEKRQPTRPPRRLSPEDQDEVTLTDRSPIDLDKTIVDEVFEDFRSKETPILRSAGINESGCFSFGSTAPRIERARDAHTTHRSASLNNIVTATSNGGPIGGNINRNTMMMTTNRERGGGERFDGFAPGTMRHSMSTVQVSPEKLRELRKEHQNYPIQSLARFVIRPSTRDIFPLNSDIDEICGKGLRRDEKSTQRNFGGKAVATQIHGERPTPRTNTIPQKSAGAARPTTSFNAKKIVAFQKNLNFPPPPPPTVSMAPIQKVSKISNSRPSPPQLPPPYCSATSSDGNAYSIATVTQQLLGTVKLLHPDWLPSLRRVLNDATCQNDVIGEFYRVLLSEKENLEEKYRLNRNEHPFSEEFSTKILVISRVLDRIDELGNGGGHASRIQQIKMIHSALLST